MQITAYLFLHVQYMFVVSICTNTLTNSIQSVFFFPAIQDTLLYKVKSLLCRDDTRLMSIHIHFAAGSKMT